MSIRLLENGDQRLLEDGTSHRLLEDGATGGGSIDGATLTVTASIVAGSAAASGSSAVGGATLTATASIVAGAANASGAAAVGGATVTCTASIVAGAATSASGTIGGVTLTATAAIVAGAASGPVTADPHPITLRIREPRAITIREGRRMAHRITRHRNAERPATTLEITDGPGALIDFSTGYTFSLKIGEVGATALLSKTTDITGAATSPNITITWAAGELDLAPGTYPWQLTATTGSADRVYDGSITILDVID